jgi:hypothetical protein
VSDQKSLLSFRPEERKDQEDLGQVFSFILCDKVKSGKESQFKCEVKRSPAAAVAVAGLSARSKSIKKHSSVNNSEKKSFRSPAPRRLLCQGRFLLSEVEEEFVVRSISPFKGVCTYS